MDRFLASPGLGLRRDPCLFSCSFGGNLRLLARREVSGGAVKVGVPAEDEEDGVVAAEQVVVAHLVGGGEGEGGELAGEADGLAAIAAD